MQIGLYSPRSDLLEQQIAAVDEFNQSACLDLALRTYDNYRDLAQDITNIPLDILVYHMEDGKETEEQILRIVQTLPNCRMLLLCDSEKHAIFGYAIHAAGYLLTPLDNEDFLAALIHLIREKIQAKEQFLPVKINGVWSQVNMKHITYLESAGHSLIFHLNDSRKLKVTAGFRHYQSLLDLNADFIRCHKSYMVNLQYVKEWKMDHFELTDGSTVSISRPYWQTTRSLYACYATQTKDVLEKEQATKKAPPAKEMGGLRQ